MCVCRVGRSLGKQLYFFNQHCEYGIKMVCDHFHCAMLENYEHVNRCLNQNFRVYNGRIVIAGESLLEQMLEHAGKHFINFGDAVVIIVCNILLDSRKQLIQCVGWKKYQAWTVRKQQGKDVLEALTYFFDTNLDCIKNYFKKNLYSWPSYVKLMLKWS